MPKRQSPPNGTTARVKQKKQSVTPTSEKPTIEGWHVHLPDGQRSTYVRANFALMSCLYDPNRLKESLTDHVQEFINVAIKGAVPPRDRGRRHLVLEEEAIKAGVRDTDPEMQRLLLRYGDYAYELFTRMIVVRLYELPDLLVEQILYKIMTRMEAEGLIKFGVKSGARRMWDDLVREYGRILKEDWNVFKPGPREVTSRAERAEMLSFYNSRLEICRAAKTTYKQHRKGRWKAQVRQRHPGYDEEFIAHLADHKPSEIATLITGKRFNKIVGRDYRGLEEVRRQLGLARKEALKNTD